MRKNELLKSVIGLILCVNTAIAAEYSAVDGDSLQIAARRLRLDGIDAPEFVQFCYDAANKEYPCGSEALQYLQKLLAVGSIRCECLPKVDIYNREICECFADDVSINEAMVAAGYAVTYRSEKYIAAENIAKTEKRGIWRGKFMRPALFRALERTNSQRKSD